MLQHSVYPAVPHVDFDSQRASMRYLKHETLFMQVQKLENSMLRNTACAECILGCVSHVHDSCGRLQVSDQLDVGHRRLCSRSAAGLSLGAVYVAVSAAL